MGVEKEFYEAVVELLELEIKGEPYGRMLEPTVLFGAQAWCWDVQCRKETSLKLNK